MNLFSMPSSNRAKQTVLWIFIVSAAVWLFLNFKSLSAGDDGVIRVILGIVLACVVIFRAKEETPSLALPSRPLLIRGLVGAVMHILGLVFDVHQFQWLGFILLFSAGVSWSINPVYVPDLNRGLFLVYWVHPLPGAIFGPMQVFLQQVSIHGAEWLLHCVNSAAWADGMVLLSGTGVFEVPAACGGMLTLVTVLMCVAGAAFLFRLSLLSSIFFCFLGLLQVVALNIIRITIMVRASASFQLSSNFLHDTAGIFLLLSVVLINLEILWWSNSGKPDKQGSEKSGGDALLGTIIRMVFAAIAAIILIVIVLVGINKRNPEHWSAMVARVAESIEHKDPASAERAMQAVLKRCPDNVEYRIQYARCLLVRQKYKEAIEVLDAVPAGKSDDNVNILRVLALSGAGRSQESMKLIDEYVTSKMNPAIAMIVAGHFARQDKPDKCSSCLLIAAQSKILLPNVRRMYPYLASRGKWDAIFATDRPVPYDDENQLLAALRARVMIGVLGDASDLLRRNRSLWEGKPAFLPVLAHIAIQVSSDKWREDFEKCFKASLPGLSADDTISYVEACFCMDRPDLASTGCSRLNEITPGHPMINLMMAKYTRQLVEYRNRLIAEAEESSTNDVVIVPDLGFLGQRIPKTLTLKSADISQFARTNIKVCIMRCNDLIAKGQSSQHLLIVKADALDLDNQPEAALAVLDEIKNAGKEGGMLITLRRARILYAKGRIHEAYEVLRKDSLQSLVWTDAVIALKVQMLQRLGLDFAALYEATSGLAKYPVSSTLSSMCAMLWDVHGYTDEALFIMKQQRPPVSSGFVAYLLERTGRGSEGQAMRSSLGMPKAVKTPPSFVHLAPAERAVTWISLSKTNSGSLVSPLPSMPGDEKISPFISGLHSAEVAWNRQPDSSKGLNLVVWENCGRDTLEKATALHRLALLLAGRNDLTGAIAAMDRALVLLPDSAMLWRMTVSLSAGDINRIKKARKILPDDPELWLAGIVSQVRSSCSEDVLMKELNDATSSARYPVETLLRAGDYLFRTGRLKSATAVSRSALQRDKSLASAYALNMCCALASGDDMSALKYAMTARESLPSEAVFLKNIARLKMKLAQNDAVLVDCLTQLVSRFPAEREWRERLGIVFFEAGNMDAAFKVFAPQMSGSITNLQPGICILMAEAARQANHADVAVNILRQAYKIYPENTVILNNLVYSLASSTETVPEAGRLLPSLLERKDINASAYDSAVFVSFRLHQPDKANQYLKEALKMLDPARDKKWYEYAVNAAEIAMSEGMTNDVRRILETIQNAPRQEMVPSARIRKIEDQLE